jgi:chromosome segregation ATPase
MALRSTKDLKDIVKNVRAASKGNGITGQLSAQHEHQASQSNFKLGSQPPSAMAMDSAKVTFSGSDKEIIEQQQREIHDLKKKMGQMKRNFDSVSHYSASDKSEFARLKNMKEQYEKDVMILKVECTRLSKETLEQKEEIKDLKSKLDVTTRKLDDKTKELEKLLEQIKKRDK